MLPQHLSVNSRVSPEFFPMPGSIQVPSPAPACPSSVLDHPTLTQSAATPQTQSHAPSAAPPPAGLIADNPAQANNQTPGTPAAASHRSCIRRHRSDAGNGRRQTPGPSHHRAARPGAPCSRSPRSPRRAVRPSSPRRLGDVRRTGNECVGG